MVDHIRCRYEGTEFCVKCDEYQVRDAVQQQSTVG